MFHKLDEVVKRYEKLCQQLTDPSIVSRQEEYRLVSKEKASLDEVMEVYADFKKKTQELSDAKELLQQESDPSLREMCQLEVKSLAPEVEKLKSELQLLLLPKDPLDDRNVMLEIRAGAGGDEASIFVADVYRMYQQYSKSLGWNFEVVSVSKGDEGIKEIICSVTGNKVYSILKFESGVHRVQRVPKTEAQGRVHTSTITVAVLPEAEEVDFELNLNEVRVDVYRASGAGGQHVNTTDSAVRLTHLPTGIQVAIQDEKSQHKNKDKAFKVLRSKLFDMKVQEQLEKERSTRKSLVGTGDRSERIRTYNFPQGRLTDHRIGLTLYSLEKIINGDLGEVSASLISHHQSELLKGEDDWI